MAGGSPLPPHNGRPSYPFDGVARRESRTNLNPNATQRYPSVTTVDSTETFSRMSDADAKKTQQLEELRKKLTDPATSLPQLYRVLFSLKNVPGTFSREAMIAGEALGNSSHPF